MTDQKNTNSSTSKQMTVDFATESPVATNMGDTGTKNECTGTAIVYCEGNFAEIDGKTANGLVRSSEKYQIMSVIDSKKEGMDAGVVLDGEEIGIPIYKSLDDALNHSPMTPDYFIYGVAPASGILSLAERMLILKAMAMGMNIVNGLHEFLNEDSEFSAAAIEHQVKILDVRKPRAKKDLRLFTGRIAEVNCPRIAVLGTDAAIGKRTTATILTQVLISHGINAVMVGTGQTGLIQGARYGVAIDAISSQFCSGEIEASILEAYDGEDPDVIIVEGQGALSHPAYLSSTFIIRGSQPDGIILQHAPKRKTRCDFDQFPMPSLASELNLIETFSKSKVIGITLNHEGMSDIEIEDAIKSYRGEFGLTVTDVLTRSTEYLLEMVFTAFPALEKKKSL
jgi:uncharacterized NAD-dependent epimerase/dehydratase family protein